MKIKRLIAFILLATVMTVGCTEDKTAATSSETTTSKSMPPNHPAVQDVSFITGKTLETFNAGGFTYVLITTPNEQIWAAGPLTTIKKDDDVGFSRTMLMKNFHSNSLNRDFEAIYFVDRFTVNGNAGAPMQVPMTQNPHGTPAPKE